MWGVTALYPLCVLSHCGKAVQTHRCSGWLRVSVISSCCNVFFCLKIMGNSSEFQKAVKLVINTVSFDKDSTVQVFEATIRYSCKWNELKISFVCVGKGLNSPEGISAGVHMGNMDSVCIIHVHFSLVFMKTCTSDAWTSPHFGLRRNTHFSEYMWEMSLKCSFGDSVDSLSRFLIYCLRNRLPCFKMEFCISLPTKIHCLLFWCLLLWFSFITHSLLSNGGVMAYTQFYAWIALVWKVDSSCLNILKIVSYITAQI